jgi:flagellar hook-associated protein 2
VLSGVTVTLTPDAAGKTQTLTIAQDSSTIEGDVSSFVTAFNAVVSQLNSLSAANTTNTAGGGGALLGDQMLNQIGQSLASIVGGSVSSGGLKTTLASLGITFNSAAAAGQSFAPLSLDSDTLDAAVQNNPAQVATLFNQTNGIAQQLNAVINTYTDPNTGVITSRTTALTNDIKSVGDQQDDLVALKAQLTQQFQDQFTALNNLMAQMETNTNFLTALFGGKNSAGSLAQGSG